ncbi:hypothetical protein Dsin_002446 [Dipteronia sinensis]|uniref:FAR1 domain-containing protein n=1 Tax=Dipteronia sinensis TaxID=43782 RepID=A0AAE0B736_9ROSI|nr:hypothetical protein Dsin_002446 [Dipteronia sinensis]
MNDVSIDMNRSKGSSERQFESCTDSSKNLYIPHVSDEHKPKLGQEFLSLDGVKEFYSSYAKKVGFSVRINSSKKSKHNSEIIQKEYVCSKEGTYFTSMISERKRRHGMTREDCNAKLSVVKSKTKGYMVKQFVEGHSHTLATPRKVHLLRSHRNVSIAKICLSKHLLVVNIYTSTSSNEYT